MPKQQTKHFRHPSSYTQSQLVAMFNLLRTLDEQGWLRYEELSWLFGGHYRRMRHIVDLATESGLVKTLCIDGLGQNKIVEVTQQGLNFLSILYGRKKSRFFRKERVNYGNPIHRVVATDYLFSIAIANATLGFPCLTLTEQQLYYAARTDRPNQTKVNLKIDLGYAAKTIINENTLTRVNISKRQGKFPDGLILFPESFDYDWLEVENSKRSSEGMRKLAKAIALSITEPAYFSFELGNTEAQYKLNKFLFLINTDAGRVGDFKSRLIGLFETLLDETTPEGREFRPLHPNLTISKVLDRCEFRFFSGKQTIFKQSKTRTENQGSQITANPFWIDRDFSNILAQ